jgi:hypothetical protein
MSDALDASQHSMFKFCVYLDVADLADRFVAPRLDSWAHAQLKKLVKSIDELLSRYHLSSEYHLRALRYAKRIGDDELLASVRSLIQLHFIWVSKDSPVKFSAENALVVNTVRKQAAYLYKEPALRHDDMPLFGFMFCFVLSLGHEFWAKIPSLTRDDRVILLSAQVYLTPPPVLPLGLDWICTLSSDNRNGMGTPIECCSECNFYPAWETVFGGTYYKQLRENTTPLFGISQLTLLPFQRTQFADLVEALTLADCQNSCAKKTVDFVDRCVQEVYVRLAQYSKDVQ